MRVNKIFIPFLCVFASIQADTSRAASAGAVVAWGRNNDGQTTVPAAALNGVIAIAAGEGHTVALKTDGRVVAWGWNDGGQTAVPIAAQSGVQEVAAGYGHTVALTKDGTVVAWGFNNFGQAAVPLLAQSGVTAIAAGFGHSVALRTNGAVVAWGRNAEGQTTVPAAAQSGVRAIAAGAAHTVALKNDGTVVAWGRNIEGQTTVPVAAQSGVRAIAAGGAHTVALKNDGTVVAWGRNTEGQTTVPNAAKSEVKAIAAGTGHTVALKIDGAVVAWGENAYGKTNVPTGLSGVTAIAAGGHTVALRNNETADASSRVPAVAVGQAPPAYNTTPIGYDRITNNAFGFDIPSKWRILQASELTTFRTEFANQSKEQFQQLYGRSEGYDWGVEGVTGYNSPDGAVTFMALVLKVPPQPKGPIEAAWDRSKSVIDYGKQSGMLKKVIRHEKATIGGKAALVSDFEMGSGSRMVSAAVDTGSGGVVQMNFICKSGGQTKYEKEIDQMMKSLVVLPKEKSAKK